MTSICGCPEPTSKGLSGLTHIIEIAMALVFIAVLLLELFTAAKSAKLMSPGAQFSHQIQISSLLPRARREALFPISRGAESQTVWSFDAQCWFMSHDSGKWTDLRILASFSWQRQLVSGRNGSHDDHLPLIRGKKKFFLCMGQPKTVSAIILSWLLMSKGNLAAKENQQGNYISNSSWNLDSTVTLQLRPLTP